MPSILLNVTFSNKTVSTHTNDQLETVTDLPVPNTNITKGEKEVLATEVSNINRAETKKEIPITNVTVANITKEEKKILGREEPNINSTEEEKEILVTVVPNINITETKKEFPVTELPNNNITEIEKEITIRDVLNMNVTEEDIPAIEVIIDAIVLGLISVTGTIGNVLTLFSILTSKQLRKSRHIMLVSLAISDILICSWSVPVNIYTTVHYRNPFDASLCDITAYIQVWCFGATLYTNAFISLKYFVAAKPQVPYYKKWDKWPVLVASLVLLWSVSFCILIVPHLAGVIRPGYFPIFGMCLSALDATDMENIGRWIKCVYGLIVVPSLVAPVYFYTRIFFIVRRRRTKFRHNSINAQYNSACRRMSEIYILFCVCWIPESIHMLVDPYAELLPRQVTRALMYLWLGNSAINPYVYALRMPDIKRVIKSYFRKERRREIFILQTMMAIRTAEDIDRARYMINRNGTLTPRSFKLHNSCPF